jgi:DNA replication protein DnaC
MNGISEQAADAAIGAAAVALRLPQVRAEAGRLADDAARAGLSHRGYLAEVLAAELDARDARRKERRIADARFPRIKRLADFELSAVPSISPASFAAISSLAFVRDGEPLVALGDPGTGKTHLLIGLGVAACEQGLRVRYVTCANLVNELAEAADEKMLTRVVARYGRLDLLLVDELGYVHLDPRGAELLFQVLTEREERSAVAVASNAPFSEWGQTFVDPRLTAAVVDRMTFRAHILETGSASYRLRSTRAARALSTPKEQQR